MLTQLLRRWWKWIGVLLILWQFFFITSWHSTQVNDSAKFEYGSWPLNNPETKRGNSAVGELQTKQLRKNKGSFTESSRPQNEAAEKSLTAEENVTKSELSTVATKEPTQLTSSEKPHLVICAKTEEYLLPIAKYFTIHRLIDGYNGLPPWNSSTLLLVDSPLCADNPYINESFARRLNSPFVDTSSHMDLLNGQWNQGVYFPNTTKMFMRVVKDRPVLIRARGEVFWRHSNTDCSDVDFVWDRQVETPSDSCFTIHYLQGVSGSYSRTDDGELGVDETTAIYEQRALHPQRPKDGTLNYAHFCSFLIRSDPDDLVEMFREKNYDVDVLVRHMFFKQLSEYKQCDRVKECPGNPYTSYKCFAGYKFHITFENSLVNGYISEKVFNGALGGGIPIYFGAADIGSYLNEKSVLHCNVKRSVIEEMRTFYPRGSKANRRFRLNNASSWPTQQELLNWADGYLRKELEPCVQRVIELDTNNSAFGEVLRQPFVTNPDIMDGMYPLRGIKVAQDALTSSPYLNDESKHSTSPQGEDGRVQSHDLTSRDHSSSTGLCPWTSNDQIVNSPCDLQLLLRWLISRVPFSFAHFNDGEVLALKRDSGKTDRGMQELSPRLQETMQHAFYQNSSGLVYGLPCRQQFQSASEFAVESLKEYTNINKTQAILFIDGNYQVAREVLLTYLLENQRSIYPRNIHLVVGDTADMDLFYKKTALESGTINFIRVPSTNAFPKGFDDNIDKWQVFEPDDIVILCAGPLGRILAVEWFVLANKTTYLELGSFFDMDLYGKSFGANYYDGDKESVCNDPDDRSWLVQKDRLLGMIREMKDPIASETGIAAVISPNRKSIHNITTIEEARNWQLAPINSSAVDASKYTIRMNTWRRNEQLIISVNHHAKCEGVASIQIIWCDSENEPPEEVAKHKSGKVVIERHVINSLNERYRILEPTPTLAVLSLDDDVLRPCEALDAAFIRWIRHPDRIVGFNARSHLSDPDSSVQWEYSMVRQGNRYSLTLPSKAAFIHRDYLDLYTAALPRSIYKHIDENFNCEDVAMSYFVSAMTRGKPPLLGDHWTVESQLQVYSQNGLSWKGEHVSTRNICINEFAEQLGLRETTKDIDVFVHPLQFGIVKHQAPSCFGYGDEPECWSNIEPHSFSHEPRLQKLVEDLQWRESLPSGELAESNTDWFAKLKAEMEVDAKKAGLVKGTVEWKMRWYYNCATDLKNDRLTKRCFTKPSRSNMKDNSTFFVCDITDGLLMHADTISDYFMFAAPPKGTGIREYAAFVGPAPPCDNVGGCIGCIMNASSSYHPCTVTVDPETCDVEVHSRNTTKTHQSPQSHIEMKDPIASETGIAAVISPNRKSIHNITTIEEARNWQLAPINSSAVDASKYTIRMNTWRRNEQLIISVNHHAKCEGVASIQIIWCDSENEPPEEVAKHKSGKVVIERHVINSLNERYRILEPTPTLAVLSLDDDVLRPCEALDAAFIRWIRHPDRIVGFDARSIVGVEFHTQWVYSSLNKNKYSLTLPSKAAFIHRDYLDLYTATMPVPILQYINTYFNCEDIGMSYFVSTMTRGKPPLLSDYWTMSAVLVELHSTNGLSLKGEHIDSRSMCINFFAELLGLKKSLQRTDSYTDTHLLMFGIANHSVPFCFGYGDEPECWSNIEPQSFSHTPRLQQLVEELQWRESLPGGEAAHNNTEWFAKMKSNMTEVLSKDGVGSSQSHPTETYCEGKGSLHQIALDLMNYSSPRGSPSYNKFKNILDSAFHFYIEKPGDFFTHTTQSVARMLEGYGLKRCDKKSSCLQDGANDSVILVDTFSWRPKSPCPLKKSECLNQPRIYIQSEQAASNAFKDMVLKDLMTCNESPSCIVWEFSEHTYNQLQDHGLWNSTILLPVMTQSPSRLSSFEPTMHKELKDRKHALVFFGYLGWKSQRRRDILEQMKSYPADWNIIYEQSTDSKFQADSYKDAMVCLISHAYHNESGGEYHRLSEFGPFGCVPVLERFADTIGIESYQRCGGAIFTNYSNLLTTSEDVIYKIRHGLYEGPSSKAIAAWWKAGIQWETILNQLK